MSLKSQLMVTASLPRLPTKVVKAPAVDLGPGVEDALQSDKYMYTDRKLYSVDSSERCQVIRLVSTNSSYQCQAHSTLIKGTGVRELVQSDATLLKPTDVVFIRLYPAN